MVYSDSKSPQSVQSKTNAVLRAGLICSAGGKVRTVQTNFTPDPMTDCPILADPLAARQPPPVSACNYLDKVVDGGSASLAPGTYCGGLHLTNGAQVTLAPGVYVVKDGPLLVDKNAAVSGTDIGIHLKGTGANLTFDTASTVSLSAPKTGPMAGLLIFDDPSGASAPANPPGPPPPGATTGPTPSGPPREHKILSNNARTLLGTIYMPQGRLIIDATSPIADKSAYTVLVVRQLNLYSGPNLFLNSDYGASEVPIPNGVGPYGGEVMLTN
jgi:hypothetical protein